MGLFDDFQIVFLIISSLFTIATAYIYHLYKKRLNLIGGWYSYILPLFVLQILILTYIGAYIAFFMKDDFVRLNQVSLESISVFMVSITYSIFVLVIFMVIYYEAVWKKEKIINNINVLFYKGKILANRQLFFIILLLFSYIFYKYITFYHQSPLYYLLNSEPIKAAEARFLIQTGINSVDIKYLSKIIEVLGFYLVLYCFILYKITNIKKYFYIFLFAVFTVCANLVFDAQKAPLIIIISCLFFVQLSMERKYKTIIYFSVLILASVIFISYLSSDVESFNFDIVISVLDRAFVGQNQGMYYILDYLNSPSYDIVEWITDDDYIPADQLIVDYMDIYAGNSNIVNVNTYYLGEAWFSFGWIGLVIAPIIVSFVFLIYLAFFDFLLSKNYLLYFPLALYTASTIPFSRSFYQIVSFKFLVYVIFFGVIPIYLINMLKPKTL